MDCNKAIHPIQEHVNESPCCKGNPKIKIPPPRFKRTALKKFSNSLEIFKKRKLFYDPELAIISFAFSIAAAVGGSPASIWAMAWMRSSFFKRRICVCIASFFTCLYT